jgi:hypothetical protein
VLPLDAARLWGQLVGSGVGGEDLAVGAVKGVEVEVDVFYG